MRQLASVALLASLVTGSLATAQEGPTPEQQAVNARQSHMQLYAFNLSALGGMAQGSIPYDAADAAAAAENLNHMIQIDQGFYWIPGTSSEEIEGSHALPKIWENMEDFQAKHAALQDAVANLVTAAGTDQATLGAAMGGVGQACGACHQAYRAPMN